MTDTIELSTREAADAAGVPYGTLKSWLADGVPVPFRTDSRGARRYGPEAVDVLKQVARLRHQDGRNLASIRVILAPQLQPVDGDGMASGREQDPAGTDPGMATGQPVDGGWMASEPDEAGMDPGPGRDGVGPDFVSAIADAVAAATVHLEDRMVAALREQTDLAEKYARAAHQLGKLEADNENLRALLAEERQKTARLEAPRPSWWRRWMGR